MGFGEETCRRYAEQKDREARRAKWILEPGWHKVRITEYRVEGHSRDRVVFEVTNSVGQNQEVPFGLRTSALKSPDLGSFHAAATGIANPALHPPSLQVARARHFKSLLGRDLAIFIEQGTSGYARVVNWAPCAQYP